MSPTAVPAFHRTVADLQQALDGCMLAERRALARRLRELAGQARAGRAAPEALDRLAADIEASRARVARRRQSAPRPSYPEDLPVSARREDIARAIAENPVVIVCGETGSGKTTQLPKICLELGRGAAGLIGHTQPRRIAARSVAARIAHELRAPDAVGYKVRFSDRTGPDARIKLMTDGILLAETQADRDLLAYDAIIIDEAHERSLNIDFLLGYVKRLLPRRPDLKLVITSATIDAERFSRHFGDAPVVEVSGRGWSVEVRWRPPREEEGEKPDLADLVTAAVDECWSAGSRGDILVFLPGEREIRDCAEALRKHHPRGAEILPLFARLSFAEQDRVFQSGGARRIVLATNVAETSLTVPNIGYVVDTGLARVNRYSWRNKVEQLLVERVSRASANQRAGRCGRVMAGVCIRLYGEEDYAARPEFGDPEILRSSLASVILRMKALKIGDPEDFPFVDPPAPRMIADGYQLLAELGAVDESRNLTTLGWQLARLPIDPRVGRMVLAGKREGCLAEVLVIASALSVQDPRERPFDRQEAADQKHRQWADEKSDFITWLNVWNFFDEALKHKKSNRKLAEQCRENFLNHVRMREWRDIHGQLHTLVTEMGMHPNEQPADPVSIHRALLTGLLGNIGCKTEEGDFLGARGIRFSIFPGSTLRRRAPQWVMAAELAETAKLYARCVAGVDPLWIEQAAAPLLRRSYHDPHWDKKGAQAAAYERVTLYGLVIVSRRRVNYGPIDPKAAREIFIRQGLVAGGYETDAPFLRHNRRLMREVEDLEHRARRQDVLVDEARIFDFYGQRIPAEVHDGRSFERWRREAERADPKLLFMSREQLMRHGADTVTEELFPSAVDIEGAKCRLAYRFEPGHPLDGVTLTLPLHLLNRVQPERFEWLVPGLIRDKLTAYLKALPKSLRRAVVPVPEHVTRFLQWTEQGAGGAMAPPPDKGGAAPPLLESLARYVHRETAQEVTPAIWEGEQLPAHFFMNFRVVDADGRELAMGRDLLELRQRLGQAASLTFGKAEPGLERDNVTRWDFGELPAQVAFSRGGQKLVGYPALVEEKSGLAIRLLDTEQAAAEAMRAGVRRLLRMELKEHVRQLEKTVAGLAQPVLQLRALVPPDAMQDDLVAAVCDRAFIGEDPVPRSDKAFEQQKSRARARLPAVTEGALRLFQSIAAEVHALNAKLASLPPAYMRVAREVKEQLGVLVHPGFMAQTPWERLQHLPRYIKAMAMRLQKFPSNPERDERHAASIAQLWQQYRERLEKHRKAGTRDPQLEEFRWQIEELRVSLFAQELKTPFPVSVKRLQKLFEGVK